MTDPDEGDRRIDAHEKELARLQSEETTYGQLEANLIRDRLKSTLGTAGVIAAAALDVISGLAAGMDASLQQMADDLNGGQKR